MKQWMTVWLLAAGIAAAGGPAPATSAAAEVRHDDKLCVSYKARLSGDYLVVEATHAPGWHTYAMDNKLRAEEKLAGKKALSVDAPTEIAVSEGLQAAGPWLQTNPKDYSKPELRWYSWIFEDTAVFATKVRRTGAGVALVEVRGQTCDDVTCKKIDLTLSVPVSGKPGAAAGVDLKSLVAVR